MLRPLVCVLNPARAPVPLAEESALEPGRRALREHRFDEAWARFQEAAPTLGQEPLSLLSDSLDRMGSEYQAEGARWLAEWIEKGEGQPDFPSRACEAGLYVSEFLSPDRAIGALEKVVERHPEEMGPRMGLATVLMHRAGTAELAPGERRAILSRVRNLLDEADARARSSLERSRARLLRVDYLAFAGHHRQALGLYEEMARAGEIDEGDRDRAEREFEAGVLSLRLHRPERADRFFGQSVAAYDRLGPDDGDRLAPPAAMALVSRYAFLGEPPPPEELRLLQESVRRLLDQGQLPTESSRRLLGLPGELQVLEEGAPEDLEALVKRMEEIEALYGPDSPLPPCLSLMTHYRPVAVAVSRVLRGEAFLRLGRAAEAQESLRLAARQFPGLPALEGRLERAVGGGADVRSRG